MGRVRSQATYRPAWVAERVIWPSHTCRRCPRANPAIRLVRFLLRFSYLEEVNAMNRPAGVRCPGCAQ